MDRSTLASLTPAALALSSLGLVLSGCPADPPAGTDGGTSIDSGTNTDEDGGRVVRCPMDESIPNPEQQEGACCYRHSQADQLDTPELRLRYIEIDEPSASPLASTTVESVLNIALGRETFNWLFQISGAGEDGDISITTGYGTRNADGTYTLGSTDYPTVELSGSIEGERITTGSVPGPLDIPIFDETGEALQMVLRLRSIRLEEANLSEERSCIGARRGNKFSTASTLEGFVTVEDARAGMIDVDPIHTSLCSVIAGELVAPSGGSALCDRARSEWTAKPDSLCGESGCQANLPGQPAVCDPETDCNAWRLVAQFAAVGIDITN